MDGVGWTGMALVSLLAASMASVSVEVAGEFAADACGQARLTVAQQPGGHCDASEHVHRHGTRQRRVTGAPERHRMRPIPCATGRIELPPWTVVQP